MEIGAAAAGFVVQAIKEWNPLSPEAYARRDRNKAYRKARRKKRRGETLTPEEVLILAQEIVEAKLPSGETIMREEPRIKARTSTKMLAVGGSLLATTAAAVIPNWDGINAAIMAACQSEHGPLIGLGMMAAMLGVNFVTARLTKSPIKPGKIL